MGLEKVCLFQVIFLFPVVNINVYFVVLILRIREIHTKGLMIFDEQY